MNATKHLAKLVLATMLALPFTSLGDAQADAKAQRPKPYPLNYCVVTGEKLGAMGKPYVFVHEGREIKLCCKSCLKEFKKDPAKYLKKIEQAEAGAKDSKQRDPISECHHIP